MSINVLFVCMGNICRSPTADAILRHKVMEAGLADKIRVDSAGTISHHKGSSPDKRAQAEGKKRGYDMRKLKSRPLQPEDFDEFQYILAMDLDNLQVLKEMQPAGHRGHVGLFLDFLPNSEYDEVPDPYYGGTKGFQLVLDLVELGCDALMIELKKHL